MTQKYAIIVLSFLAFVGSSICKAQAPTLPPFNINQPGLQLSEVLDSMRARISPNDTGEGGGRAQLDEWARTWKVRATQNDSSGLNMFQQYFRAAQVAATSRLAGACNNTGFAGNWTNLGPDSLPSQNLGLLRDVWACPSDTNYLLAASYGGLFKSTDAGLTWHCITDNAPGQGFTSPVSIAVNPRDSQEIYLGTGTYYFQVTALEGYLGNFYKYGGGVLHSTNGGATWQQEILAHDVPPSIFDSLGGVERVYYAPDGGRVYGLRNYAIFCKESGSAWQEITPDSILDGRHDQYIWQDMDFVPKNASSLDSNHFFAATHGRGFSQIVEGRYNPTTHTHTFSRIPIPFSDTVDALYMTIPTGNMLYAAFVTNNTTVVWKYTISSKAWTYISTIPWSIWQIEASKSNPANLYIADMFGVSRFSPDTGHTLIQISTYYGSPTHGDVRNLHIHSTTNTSSGVDDRVYLATDGGIAMKTIHTDPAILEYNTCKNINGKGLAVGRFMGVGTSEQGGVVLGSQGDNSYDAYEPNKLPKWNFINNYSDAEEAVFSRTEQIAYGGSSGGGVTTMLDKIYPGRGRILGTPKQIAYIAYSIAEPHSGIIPMWADQFGGLYIGRAHMWRVLPGTINLIGVNGLALQPTNSIYDINLPEYWPDQSKPRSPIKCMTFSQYLDTLTGYVVYEDGATFYRNVYTAPLSLPDRTNFKPISSLAVSDYPVNDIVCNPYHPERVWEARGALSFYNTPRFRAIYSPDAGRHWFDISKGLPPKIPVTHIVYQEGTDFVYCSTDVGIFRLDMSGFSVSDSADILSAYNTVQWTCFNKGAIGQPDFPMVNVTDLEINYCAGKLYASTYGRSIWSTDLLVDDPNSGSPIIGDIVPEQTEIISTNTIWSSDKTIYTGIRILSGAKLTINNTAGAAQTVINMPFKAINERAQPKIQF